MFIQSKSIFVNGKQYTAFVNFANDELRITCDGKEIYRDMLDEYTNFTGNMEAFLTDQSLLGRE